MSDMNGILGIITNALEEKKALEVKVINVKGKTSLADFFVVCHATSVAHSKALAKELQHSCRDEGFKVLGVDNADDNSWTVLDYGDVIVHLFLEDARRFYDIDSIWLSSDPSAALKERTALMRERQPLDVRSIFKKAASGKGKTRK